MKRMQVSQLIDILAKDMSNGRHYYSQLYAHAKKIGSNSNDCEEILGNLFLNLAKNQTYIIKGNPITWLYGCLKRSESDYIRGKYREKRKGRFHKTDFDSLEVQEFEDEQNNNPAAALINDEKLQNLENALASLNPISQKVFQLYYWEGASHKEISQACNIPIKTAANLLYVGRKKLRRIMGEKNNNL